MTVSHGQHSPRTRFVLALALYAAIISVVAGAMFTARTSAIASLSTAESIEDWRQWREDVQLQQTQPGAVARRVPKSAEPPGLVLMRDYFTVCLVGALIFTTLLYGVLAWLLIGAISSRRATPTADDPA